LALGGKLGEPKFAPSFLRVAGATQSLKIGKVEREFLICSHRLNVIDLETMTRTAFHALKAVAPLGRLTQRWPPPIAVDP
jgi:hypothetical protein